MPDIAIRASLVSLVALREAEAGYEILLLKRTQSLAGTWCQIAGSLEDGETAWQAALRELSEETGLTPRALYSADTCEQFYTAAADTITIAPVFVAFVDRAAPVTLNAEHSDFRWVGFEDAAQMVSFGGQRRVLRWIEDEFIRRRPSDHLRIDMG